MTDMQYWLTAGSQEEWNEEESKKALADTLFDMMVTLNRVAAQQYGEKNEHNSI